MIQEETKNIAPRTFDRTYIMMLIKQTYHGKIRNVCLIQWMCSYCYNSRFVAFGSVLEQCVLPSGRVIGQIAWCAGGTCKDHRHSA